MTFYRNLEFYDLDPEDFNLRELLPRIHGLPNAVFEEGKILSVGADYLSLVEYQGSSDYDYALIARLRKQDVPVKGSLERNRFEEIVLRDDEGIAEMTFLCYIRTLNVLTLLPARNGPKWGSITHYLSTMQGEDLQLMPLLDINAQNQLQRFGHITFVEAQIPVGNNRRSSSSRTRDLSLGQVVEDPGQIGAAQVDVKLYNKKREGGLNVPAAKALIRDLLRRIGSGGSHHLKVKGSDTAIDRDIIIDLITQKFQIPLEIGSNSRRLQFDECRQIVTQAVERRLADIRELVE